MKKELMTMALSVMLTPVFAQTNTMDQSGKERSEWRRSEHGKRKGEGGERKFMERFREMTPEQKAQLQERRLQLMEKTLKEIGITDQQRQQIKEMQLRHREEMKKASEVLDKARRNLSELEKNSATEKQIFKAIDLVATAQADQMKVLARNKMEMERILGKEKYGQFMEAARNSYRSHGRRGGYGLPPVPDRYPPAPNHSESKTTPPVPENQKTSSPASA